MADSWPLMQVSAFLRVLFLRGDAATLFNLDDCGRIVFLIFVVRARMKIFRPLRASCLREVRRSASALRRCRQAYLMARAL